MFGRYRVRGKSKGFAKKKKKLRKKEETEKSECINS